MCQTTKNGAVLKAHLSDFLVNENAVNSLHNIPYVWLNGFDECVPVAMAASHLGASRGDAMRSWTRRCARDEWYCTLASCSFLARAP